MRGPAVAHGTRSAAYPSERLAVQAGRFARGSLGKVTASPNIPLWRDPNGHAHTLIGVQIESSLLLLSSGWPGFLRSWLRRRGALGAGAGP